MQKGDRESTVSVCSAAGWSLFEVSLTKALSQTSVVMIVLQKNKCGRMSEDVEKVHGNN